MARFALEQPHDLALGTVAAIARGRRVQPSSMIRFANALGFGGFSRDAADVPRATWSSARAATASASTQMRRKRTSGASRASRRAAPVRQRRRSRELGHLEESVAPRRRSTRAVRLIAGAPRIHVLAQRRAFPVACYLAYALSQLELRTHLLDGVGGMLREVAARHRAARSADRRELSQLLAPSVIEAAAAATARRPGDRDHRQPALAAEAGRRASASSSATTRPQPFRSLVAPLCLAQALVVSVGHRWPSAARLRRRGSRARSARDRRETARNDYSRLARSWNADHRQADTTNENNHEEAARLIRPRARPDPGRSV